MFGLDEKDTGSVLRWINIFMVLLGIIAFAYFTYIIIFMGTNGFILPGMFLRWSMYWFEVNDVRIFQNTPLLLSCLLFFGIPLGLLFAIGVPFIFIRSIHQSGNYSTYKEAKERLNFIIRNGSRMEKGVVVLVTVSFAAAYVYLLLLVLYIIEVIRWLPPAGILFFFVLLNACITIARRVIH